MGLWDKIQESFNRVFRPETYRKQKEEEEKIRKEKEEKERLRKEIEETKLTKENIKAPPKSVEQFIEKSKRKEEEKRKREEEPIDEETKASLQKLREDKVELKDEAYKALGLKEEEIEKERLSRITGKETSLRKEETLAASGVGIPIRETTVQDPTEGSDVDSITSTNWKEVSKAYRRGVGKSQDEINAILNQRMAEGWTGFTAKVNTRTGQSYQEEMVNIVQQSGVQIDRSIAELIVQNSDKFRPRFTTYLDIYSDEIYTATITLEGVLPYEVAEEAERINLDNEEITSQKLTQLTKHFGDNLGALGRQLSGTGKGKVTGWETRATFR